MNLKFLLFIPVFLLTVSAFAQKQNIKKISVRLHALKGDLVSFKQNGYVISFSRQELLDSISAGPWFAECEALLTTSDTLDLDSTVNTIRLIERKYSSTTSIDYVVSDCFYNGNVIVFSGVSGKNLSHLDYICDNSRQNQLIRTWHITDPKTDKELFVMGRLTMSF